MDVKSRRAGNADDRGMAMIAVLLVMAVLAVLGTTVTVMAVSSTRSATADAQGGIAQNVSEAGVAQAIAWIRSNGVGQLACSPSCNPATGQADWGQGPSAVPAGSPYGHLVVASNGQQYRVWIETKQAYSPPTVTVGTYSVHSEGKFNGSVTATGTRVVSQDLSVTPFQFPLGVFAHTVAAGGNGGIHFESLFSDSCIQGRGFETFEGTDIFYNVPAAAHSADSIVEKQNAACGGSTSIHNGAACNTSYPNDTDKYGGTLTAGTPCYGNATMNGAPWLTTSQESSFSAMAQAYHFAVNPLGLSNSQYDALRTQAQQQGLYFTNTTAIPAALQAANASTTLPFPVLFYDLKGAAAGGLVDLSQLTGYSRGYPLSATDPGCKPFGAIVVVLNGNIRLNSNTTLVASVFAPGPYPNGQVSKANGTSRLIGTLYADHVDMRGTSQIYLDSCFAANLPGSLLTVTLSNYREEDR